MTNQSYDAYNAAYVQALYDRFLQNPSAVDAAWRDFFATDAGTQGLLGGQAGNGAAAPVAAVATVGGAAPSRACRRSR